MAKDNVQNILNPCTVVCNKCHRVVENEDAQLIEEFGTSYHVCGGCNRSGLPTMKKLKSAPRKVIQQDELLVLWTY